MNNNVRPETMERITTKALADAFIDEQVALIRQQVKDKKVLLALSGGVDSSVVAALLIKAIGKQLVCVHVNHGLLRKGEPEQVVEVFRNQMDANLVYVDAVERFLGKLKGVAEPEKKRKIIGAEFIRVFEEEARKLEGIEFLAQGTIYPDIIESDGVKAHHNVGGLPEDMQFELVEPLRLLYKDEVRTVGSALGLPDDMVYRQPFPGPGLGVRCLGEITRERLEAVRESDAILREEFALNGLEAPSTPSTLCLQLSKKSRTPFFPKSRIELPRKLPTSTACFTTLPRNLRARLNGNNLEKTLRLPSPNGRRLSYIVL